MLAAALVSLAPVACGEGGAEPDAPDGVATPRALELILDFQPNPVHAGIYAAIAEDEFSRIGIEPTVRIPGDSSDAPKLLQAGRVDLAVLDIHDLAIARAQGADLVGIGAIIQRPLAAVIADAEMIDEPVDLAGKRVGVTGLPSDDAVLQAIFSQRPSSTATTPPRPVTIGFNSVSALANGRVDAATAFWNAEGVALKSLGVQTREFRVDDFGAPAYPELILVASRDALKQDPSLYADAREAIRSGYELVVSSPDRALELMLEELPEADADAFGAQMNALVDADAFAPPLKLDREVLGEWAKWDERFGIVEERPEIDRAFDLDP